MKHQQLLVFCQSRKACESCAKFIRQHATAHVQVISHRPTREVTPDTLHGRRKAIVDKLATSEVCVDAALAELIMSGIAYHHAGTPTGVQTSCLRVKFGLGLTELEREIVEDAYRDGIISILCATTTLAAGVNLPAGRVIIRRLRAASHKLDVCGYRQMVGRAGRAGQSELGIRV